MDNGDIVTIVILFLVNGVNVILYFINRRHTNKLYERSIQLRKEREEALK